MRQGYNYYCWVKSDAPSKDCQDAGAKPSLDECIRDSPNAYRTRRLESNLLSCMSKKGWQLDIYAVLTG